MNTTYAMSPRVARLDWGATEFRAVSRRFGRRVRAIVRLLRRRRRAARRFDDLRHLDERTLRDLGVSRSELTSVVAELGGRAASTRRRTDLAFWTSASSTFRIRAIDTSL